MKMTKTIPALMVSIACLTAAACVATAQTNTPPQKAPVKWPWGAKVNEAVFAPGGSGVTIHAAPDGKRQGDGSAARPYDLTTAMEQAVETVHDLDAEYQRLSEAAISPQWLRITRRGNVFAAFSASDDGGKPGAWKAAGEPKTIAMSRDALAGFLVTSDMMWPQNGTAAEAKFDNVALNGEAIGDGVWQSKRVGVSYGEAAHKATNGEVVVRGNGLHSVQRHNEADSGQYVYVPFRGDGEFVARLSGLTPSGHSQRGMASLMVRESLLRGARMMQLEVAQNGANSGLWRSFRADRATPGKDVKVLLAPGVYRSRLPIPGRDEVAQKRTFVIEGAKLNGKTGGVIFSGSEEWKPATWNDEGNGVYSRSWTQNWGGKNVSDRREMIFLTARGGTMQRLSPVLAADWKSAPGTFTVDEDKDTIRFRLPADWDATSFNTALVEVPTHENKLVDFGFENARPDDNLVLRNLVFQHSASHVAVQLNWWAAPPSPNRNWMLEDVTLRHNIGLGFSINHLRAFTLRRVHSHDNGLGNWAIAAEGQIIDTTIERNGWRQSADCFWNALKNVYVYNSSFSYNRGNSFRNDHVAENLLIDNCRFNENSLQAFMFETATGPITIRNSEVKGNNHGAGTIDDAAAVISTVHNFTLDGVTFENNKRSALAFYPRERAHTANQAGVDELNNNLDVGAFDQDNTPLGRATPGGKKAASENRNFIIRNCTFLANDPGDSFIIEHYYRRTPAYLRNIQQELRAYNNRYYHPQNPRPFQLNSATWMPDAGDIYGTFAEWKAQSAQPHFEAGSAWGTTAPRNFTMPRLALATSSKTAFPSSRVNGRLVYEVEKLPFKASKPVELLSAPGKTTNTVHKLHVDQVGDFGDWVEYSINVPEAGRYFMDVRYLQDGRPFNYLGYAQVKVNGAVQGDWWDQHGLTRQLMTHHVGPVQLKAGANRVRFDSVWRNGYLSGDYDITVDRIELSKSLNLLPVAAGAPAQNGLQYRLYAGGDWTRLPNFDAMQPLKTGTTSAFDLTMAAGMEKFGVRFTGFIEVPRDGIYTFATLVNDGANLYIGNRLVVDNDGVHDGEKNEPWQKRGNIALKAGKHPIRLDYFESGGLSGGKGHALEVLWAPAGEELRPVDPATLAAVSP